jgi:hypothetical protein
MHSYTEQQTKKQNNKHAAFISLQRIGLFVYFRRLWHLNSIVLTNSIIVRGASEKFVIERILYPFSLQCHRKTIRKLSLSKMLNAAIKANIASGGLPPIK